MAYEEAAQFLAKVMAWPDASVDPPEFFVNIHHPYRREDGKVFWPGRACRSLREALGHIQWLDHDNVDVYVCMSTQRMAKAKTDKTGRVYYAAARGHEAAVWHKSIYVDVDVKPDDPKCYPTTIDAYTGLEQFLKATGLPDPTFVVASGSGGFHAHWVFDEPVRTERWRSITNAFLVAIYKSGFKADVKCTGDAVRLLRVPNTANHKHSPPKPVEIAQATNTWPVQLIEDVLAPYKNEVVPRASRPVVNGFTLPPGFQLPAGAPAVTDLVPNRQERLASFTDLKKVCPFAVAAHVAGGRDYREPLWFETLKLAYYLSDGRAAAHAMSNAHRTYSEAETNEKFDRIIAEREQRDMYGWPLCSTIQNAGAVECGGCQWMARGMAQSRSPLHFVGQSPEQQDEPPPEPTAQLATDAVPSGYEMRDHVLHKHVVDDKTGAVEVLPIWSAKTRSFWMQPAPNRALVFEMLEGGDTWLPVVIPTVAINEGGAALSRALGQFGLVARNKLWVGDAMGSFVEMLRERREFFLASEANGWSNVDGEPDAFCYGGQRYNCNGAKPTSHHDSQIQLNWMPVGKPDALSKAIDFVHGQDRPELDAALAAGFGAPLMEFTSQRGAVFHLRSIESGHGKTSVLRVITALYGNPLALNRFDDTQNSLGKVVSTLRNLPVCIDEVHNVREFIKIAFALTSGKGKSRLGRSSQHMQIETHATIMITASNYSLRDAASELNTSAASYRVLEVDVNPRHTDRAIDYDQIFQSLNGNYGHAGATLAAFLGSNAKQVRHEVLGLQEQLKAQWRASDQERFWIALTVCMLLGATYANKLGIAHFNLKKLTAYLYREFRANQQRMAVSPLGFDKPENKRKLVEDFLMDQTTVTLTTDVFPAARGRAEKVTVVTSHDTLRYAKKLHVHRAEKEGRFIISRRAIIDFAKKRSMGSSEVADLEQIGGKVRRATLGAGTIYPKTMSLTNEYVIEFDENHPAMLGIFNEVAP